MVSKRNLEPGDVLGKCEVVRRLGKGGMGAVYLAVHATLRIYVAVKVLDPAQLPEGPVEFKLVLDGYRTALVKDAIEASQTAPLSACPRRIISQAAFFIGEVEAHGGPSGHGIEGDMLPVIPDADHAKILLVIVADDIVHVDPLARHVSGRPREDEASS